MTAKEIPKLLQATRESSNTDFGMAGPERALLYWPAVETGLRSNEIRSLRVMDFYLDEKHAHVTVRAAYSKRRKTDTQYLRPELTEALREHLRRRMPQAPVFELPHPTYMARMLHGDLEAAEIPIVDERGKRLDFHALRHTFVTLLASSGVSPPHGQEPGAALEHHADDGPLRPLARRGRSQSPGSPAELRIEARRAAGCHRDRGPRLLGTQLGTKGRIR